MERFNYRTELADHGQQLQERAQAAIKHGNRHEAYQISLDLTREYPNNAEGWLLRARLAPSTEEVMYALSQVNRINPNHPATKLFTYQAMWSQLERDPFLAYVDESEDTYFVRSRDYLSLVVPKHRNTPEIYPPIDPQPLSQAYKFLLYAVFGLVLSGLGTLVFAPLAVFATVNARRKDLSKQDQARARIIIWLAFILLAPASLLVLIFVLHFRGF
jgi:hypothetical protein